MTRYYISQEFHAMPGTMYGRTLVRPIDFFYALRREHDKSLVFRAETIMAAETLLERLYAFARVAA